MAYVQISTQNCKNLALNIQEMIKIYSFDIFDTLLLRPYIDPQEVWQVLEEQEHCRGFAKARKKADMKSYERATKEYRETTIEEAYALMPSKYLYMMEKEMSFERQVLTGNPEMLERWNMLGAQGYKRIIISDMYLPQDFIESVLKENGIDGWDAFYLSRTHNARKTTGELFKIMLKEQGVKPEEITHTGDNIHSDVEVPQALGIHTVHYNKIVDIYIKICPFARHLDQRLAGILALGYHNYTQTHKDKEKGFTYWHRFGYNIGGVLGYIYVSWLVNKAKQLGYNKLLFVARDGYVWKRICEALYPEIETDYIYAPRITSIALLGIIGHDPIALKNRKEYFDKHMQDINRSEIEKEYKQYASQFNIDEHTAIVDGFSSAFSAQRLIEYVTGKNIFAFYEVAMAKMQHAAALMQTNLYCPPFLHLTEFLFGAPENPIVGIKNLKPVYNQKVTNEELFKISHSQEIADAAVQCCKLLKASDYSFPKFGDFCDLFMQNLTDEDKEMLAQAKDAGDIEQKKFVSAIYKPRDTNFHIKKHQIGNFSYELNINTHNKTHYFKLSRTQYIHFVDNYSIEYDVYVK